MTKRKPANIPDVLTQFDAVIARSADSASKINIPGGIVGKICAVLIATSIAIASVTWFVHEFWVGVLAIVLIFLLVLILGWRAVGFATENPQAALMEGAQLLLYEKMKQEISMKNQPAIPDLPSERTEAVGDRLLTLQRYVFP